MIASWMLYTALVGVLVTLAAIGLDRVAITRARPVRMIWFSALLLSIALPIGRAAIQLAPKPVAPVQVIPFTITVQSPAMRTRASVWNRENVDRAFMYGWFALSALLLFRLTRSMLTLRRTRGTWSSTDVDGTSVRLSKNVGPAVIGLRSMDVVIPEWILSLDAPLRAIVLRHEEEHRSARDPYLLFAAALGVALMPWNLALWIQARRLRLAIELDCDARVLRAHPSTERYGMLMLTIAQRRSVGPTLFSPMLTEPTTLLERRILAMRPATRRLARVTIYGGSALAVAALVFACSLQSDTTGPTSPRGKPIPVTDNQDFLEYQVEKPAELLPGNPSPEYPPLLRNEQIEGKLVTRFVVDTTGRAMMPTFQVLNRTDERFIPSVRAAIPNLRFSPAQVGGKPVKQVVEMPFEFNLNHDGPGGSNGSVGFAVTHPELGKVEADLVRGGERRGTVRTTRDGSDAIRTKTVLDGVRKEEMTLPKGVYFEYQVEQPVSPANNQSPRYPDAMRESKTPGEVLAQFIVDENGSIDSTSFRILRATNEDFAKEVRMAIRNYRFNPALVGGKPVRQFVQMPFQFNLKK
ncbi:MAG TPA: M56 family metallopeptidase [Gemmatimonadaceae bacterium]|nr:M56 family metallopeptidase [Gemmatimonadaceae bacterium]